MVLERAKSKRGGAVGAESLAEKDLWGLTIWPSRFTETQRFSRRALRL
jgi:hypothetical protein